MLISTVALQIMYFGRFARLHWKQNKGAYMVDQVRLEFTTSPILINSGSTNFMSTNSIDSLVPI